MTYAEVYRLWTEKATDSTLVAELKAIENDSAAIEDRFYRELEFGTGGLRGVLGAGTNRMNIYTVRRATQGLSDYLNNAFPAPSVAIAYDSRINSELFARTAAEVFVGNGICVYIYPKLMPTPVLSFAVRDLHCSGGVVITASHNPAEYNGYKVYGGDGCQITTGVAKAIQAAINWVNPFEDIRRTNYQDAAGRITVIGEDTVERYLAAVGTTSVLPDDVSREVSIVYTPLNGTGITCVPRCLRQHGFTNITIPAEQEMPDGGFPTCPYPNPEIRQALEVGLAWAERVDSDLLLATDPDCDRVGAAVRSSNGYTLITGNEMGVLLLDFVCRMRRLNGTMPERPVAVKTIVTTPMAEKIAANYNVELLDVLTGFKYIGEQIGILEQKGEESRYIFGFEESCGYLSGSFVRDKDAVNASLLICEMYAYYKSLGRSLLDVLSELYETYGYFQSKLLSFSFEGAVGSHRITELMAHLRYAPPKEIGGFTVERCIDYLQVEYTGLPSSDVLRFFLRGGQEAAVRPSGTEPKLKVYLTAVGSSLDDSKEILGRLAESFERWIRG